MKNLLADLVDAAAGRVEYADARLVQSRAERIATRNGAVDQVLRHECEGVGVRVRMGGAWGFAASHRTDRRALDDALHRALTLADTQPAAAPAALAPEEPRRGEHHGGAVGTDPFSVSLEDKLEVLLAADAAMAGDARVVVREASLTAHREDKLFASTDGAMLRQVTSECGGGLIATASNGAETQVRSYPGSFRGHVAQAGYEHFRSLDLVGNAARVAAEAVELLSAAACPEGPMTLVLDGEQLALQVHESVGHALELDRVLGSEASYAGTSFVAPDDRGALRYGSPLMNVTADATVPGGLGTFAWDDEGVAAQAVPLVREGVLEGFLSSRESAAAVGLERSAGCMRASGFDRQPLVRMTNVNLEPGDAGSLRDLIADTDSGIYMETNRSWSIDSRRLQFQFATELAREIRGGELGRLYRNPSYGGVTPAFWAALDAVCSEPEWRLWSVLNCGKGEPGQAIRASHGTAPARFRDVRVGVA